MVRPTVGQVGLGNMGGNLAKHLLDEGFEVHGFDVDEAAMADFEDYGGEPAASNADLAGRVDVLLSALNYPEIVEAAYLGPDGVLAGAEEGLICFEQSTVPPASVRELGESVTEAGVHLLDAPFLSGGPRFARTGEMVIPVGGDRAVFEDDDAQVVLDAQSRSFHHMGPLGTGKATKLVNNVMALTNTAVALEALALGAAQGLEPGELFETLRYASGSSVMFRVGVPQALNRDFAPEFPVSSTLKDLRFALRAAEETDFPMAIASTTLQQYTATAAKGYADEATPALLKVYEEYVGDVVAAEEEVELRTDDPVYSA